MVDRQLISAFEAAKAREHAAEMTERLAIEEQRLKLFTDNIPAQLSVQREQMARLAHLELDVEVDRGGKRLRESVGIAGTRTNCAGGSVARPSSSTAAPSRATPPAHAPWKDPDWRRRHRRGR